VKAKFLDINLDKWVSKYGPNLDFKSVASYGALPAYIARNDFIKTEGYGYDVLIVERHPTTSTEVFDTSDELRLLYLTVDRLTGSAPENTIYIKNNPRVCHERTKRRQKDGEVSLSETNINEWHVRHEEMMAKREGSGGKVFVVDAFGAESHLLSPEIAAFIGFF
jgi:thymidylate kinase